MMELIALEGNWLVGDWLNDAANLGITEERVAALNADPRWEGTHCGELIFIAQRFRPSKRKHKVPWLHYAAVAALPDEVAHPLLARSSKESWSLTELKREVSKAKKPAVKKKAAVKA